jgi:hypothetical protein
MGNAYEQKHYGFFRGIVMQNNDPERRGRVKIAIPEFTSHLARDLGLPADIYSARFVGGDNINTFFNKDALKKFCDVLIWAEQAAPLIGGGTAGVFDAKNGVATVGEGYKGTGLREPIQEESITPSGESVSPKAAISINANPGGFEQGYRTGLCDVYNQTYAPSPINNATKGMFSVPRVGSQVWLFFENGNLDNPVYIGYVFDKQDWNSVMNPQGSNPSPHYPAGAENRQNSEPYFFSGQTVFNSKAGSLEFVETDDFEKIKLSHYSGSFYEINNHVVAEICTENKTSIVNQNEHHTVKGDFGQHILGDAHIIYRSDVHITYGDPDNKTYYDEWREKAAPAFANAALFSEQGRYVLDPTETGESKGGPNKTFSHPPAETGGGGNGQLTLKTDWTTLLTGMNPSEYMKKVAHTELGVK